MAKKQLKPDETAFMCEQLAAILNSGMQLYDGIDILAEDIGNKRLKIICSEMSKSLYDGETLYDAMDKTGVFPDYAVKMVKIGMLSGRLEDILKGLSEYYENNGEMRRTVRSAILNPLMLLIMMTVVIVVLVVQVIPMFSDIFARFDGSVAQTIENAVEFASAVGMTILAVLSAIIIITAVSALLMKIPAVRRGINGFFSAFPLTSGIMKRYAQAQLAGAMSIMVSGGITPEEALENAAALVTNKKLSRQINKCRNDILEGAYFADALCESKIFPAIHGKTLKISYLSGSFDAAWKKVSSRCKEDAERTTENMIAFIEPAIVIILAAMIGSILLTVMLPLMNIMSVLG